ncbi:MAG: hypothetical protein KDD53_12330, partial [Bdellovibrionales bacterium]|nr:hypothetical protein [Bdellovibrionales bacterium]
MNKQVALSALSTFFLAFLSLTVVNSVGLAQDCSGLEYIEGEASSWKAHNLKLYAYTYDQETAHGEIQKKPYGLVNLEGEFKGPLVMGRTYYASVDYQTPCFSFCPEAGDFPFQNTTQVANIVFHPTALSESTWCSTSVNKGVIGEINLSAQDQCCKCFSTADDLNGVDSLVIPSHNGAGKKLFPGAYNIAVRVGNTGLDQDFLDGLFPGSLPPSIDIDDIEFAECRLAEVKTQVMFVAPNIQNLVITKFEKGWTSSGQLAPIAGNTVTVSLLEIQNLGELDVEAATVELRWAQKKGESNFMDPASYRVLGTIGLGK